MSVSQCVWLWGCMCVCLCVDICLCVFMSARKYEFWSVLLLLLQRQEQQTQDAGSRQGVLLTLPRPAWDWVRGGCQAVLIAHSSSGPYTFPKYPGKGGWVLIFCVTMGFEALSLLPPQRAAVVAATEPRWGMNSSITKEPFSAQSDRKCAGSTHLSSFSAWRNYAIEMSRGVKWCSSLCNSDEHEHKLVLSDVGLFLESHRGT